MRWHTRSGPESDCPLKPSGNSLRAAAWPENSSLGATNSSQTESGWPTPTRDISRTPIRETTATSGYLAGGAVSAERYGLYDMAGDVWQWTSDWYRPDYYQRLAAAGGVVRNPQGPDTPFDPAEPTDKKRVHRGGSFLCTDQYCSRYMVGTRGKGEVSTGTNHLGFRCVKPAPGTTKNSAQGT